MQKITKLWKGEALVYSLIWLAVLAVCLLNPIRERNASGRPLFDVVIIWNTIKDLLPLFVLFVVNTYVLVPRLLLKNKIGYYCLAALVMIVGIWLIQISLHQPPPLHRFHGPPPHLRPHGTKPLIFLPHFLDAIYDILVVGLSLAVALVFQRYRERLIMEQRLKNDADARLNYLKAQMTPHFYMNMLNNLHGLIEIEPEKAQQMVIDMSQLMRYLLYESTQRNVPLSKEVEFVRNYIVLMQSRYPEEKLKITIHYPSAEDMRGVVIPPLLFVVFIENAFKHGISFRRHSWVDINIGVSPEGVTFMCSNSCDTQEHSTHKPGIGLANVMQRLSLIYGDESIINITHTKAAYSITLILPKHENTHSHS